MIVVKAPLRVSLFGGGTDIPEYYQEHGATIVSFALDKSIYVIHNPRPSGGYRLAYSKVEELNSLKEAKHTIVKAWATKQGSIPPCTLSIISDLPKGTGLGSSSALTIALHHLLYGDNVPLDDLVHDAFNLERQLSPVGIQDFLPAAHGGFNIYTIERDGSFAVQPVVPYYKDLIERYGLLLYTGQSREANVILRKMPRSMGYLQSIHGLARSSCMDKVHPVETLVQFLEASWEYKRRISGASSKSLDEQYKVAKQAGALGGKLCGAGGGGCWFFLVPPNMRHLVKAKMRDFNCIEIPFYISSTGVQDWAI